MLSVGLHHTSESDLPDFPFMVYTFQQHPLFISTTLILINLMAFGQIRSTNKSVMIGISVLRLVYFFLLGDKVNSCLMMLHECSNHDYHCPDDYKYALKFIPCGGVVSIFFWGCSSAVLPFHHRHLPASQNRAWWKRLRLL